MAEAKATWTGVGFNCVPDPKLVWFSLALHSVSAISTKLDNSLLGIYKFFGFVTQLSPSQRASMYRRQVFLVPRSRAPSGQHHKLWPLCWTNTMQKSPILGLRVKSDKSDWLRIWNEYSALAQKIRSSYSRFLELTKRCAFSRNENGGALTIQPVRYKSQTNHLVTRGRNLPTVRSGYFVWTVRLSMLLILIESSLQRPGSSDQTLSLCKDV